MLNAGKNVLCEKPLGMSLKQVQEMIDLAKSKNVFFMEAIWSRTFPLYETFRIRLASIGDVKQVYVTFGQGGNDGKECRLSRKELGGGTVKDWGVYCLQMCLLAFDGQRPNSVTATAIKINENGVDIGLTAVLKFPNDGMAAFTTDLRVDLPCSAIVTGTKGTITVSPLLLQRFTKLKVFNLQIDGPFHCPTKMEVKIGEQSQEFQYEIPQEAPFSYNYVNSGGLLYEANHVRQCLKENLKESPLVTLQDSLLIAEIQEAIMEQIGVSYV